MGNVVEDPKVMCLPKKDGTNDIAANYRFESIYSYETNQLILNIQIYILIQNKSAP